MILSSPRVLKSHWRPLKLFLLLLFQPESGANARTADTAGIRLAFISSPVCLLSSYNVDPGDSAPTLHQTRDIDGAYMDILENNIIGNFILGLGHAMGQRSLANKPEPISLNLLQQTPLDTCLGDVLIANARVVRLVEFKREANRDRKERAKHHLLTMALSAPGLEDILQLSRKIHWFVLSNFDRADRTSIVVPYLDMLHPTGTRDLDQFIIEVVADIAGPGMTDSELSNVKHYLRVLGEYAGSRDGSKGGAVGGLLFTLNAKGEAKYILIENVRELAMEPRLVIARHVERQKLLEEQQVRHEQEQEKLRLEQRMYQGPTLRVHPRSYGFLT